MPENRDDWGYAGRKAGRQMLFPWRTPAPSGTGGSPLLTIRIIFLAFCLALLMFGFVLFFVLQNATPKDAAPALALVGVGGVLCIGGVLWARSRPLQSDDPTILVQSFFTTFFIGVAFADAPGLLGFAGSFIAGRFSPYLIGLAFAAVGFALVAPTHGAVRRRDEQLVEAGSPYLLSEALQGPSSGGTPTRPD